MNRISNQKKLLLTLTLVFFALFTFSQSPITHYKTFETFKEKEFTPTNNNIKVINFWATWCVPCVKELPYFDSINNTSIENTKIEVLLVSLDFEETLKNRLPSFIQKKNIKNKVALLTDPHPNEWIEKVDKSWSGAIPATIILHDQQTYFFEKQYHSTKELKEEITKILNQ